MNSQILSCLLVADRLRIYRGGQEAVDILCSDVILAFPMVSRLLTI